MKNKRVVIYEISCNGETMYSRNKPTIVGAVEELLPYIGSEIKITSFIKTTKWWDRQPDFDGWKDL